VTKIRVQLNIGVGWDENWNPHRLQKKWIFFMCFWSERGESEKFVIWVAYVVIWCIFENVPQCDENLNELEYACRLRWKCEFGENIQFFLSKKWILSTFFPKKMDIYYFLHWNIHFCFLRYRGCSTRIVLHFQFYFKIWSFWWFWWGLPKKTENVCWSKSFRWSEILQKNGYSGKKVDLDICSAGVTYILLHSNFRHIDEILKIPQVTPYTTLIKKFSTFPSSTENIQFLYFENIHFLWNIHFLKKVDITNFLLTNIRFSNIYFF